MPYDFFIPSYNIIIELDGPHHFEQIHKWNSPEETVRRDVLKMKYALEHKLSIIRCMQIEYYKNTDNVANENLIPHIKTYDNPIIIYNTQNDTYYNNHKHLLRCLVQHL